MTGQTDRFRLLEEAMRKEADDEVNAAIDAARREAAEIVGTARRAARARLAKAVRAMRAERQARLRKASAQLSAAERKFRQDVQMRVLGEAVAELTRALEKRWQDAKGRRQWCLSLVEKAADKLEPGRWTVEHAPGWDGDGDSELVEALTRACGNRPAVRVEPEIATGLRIRAANACLDGTIDGLLVQRDWIEATLLALLDKKQEAGAS